MLAGVAFRSLRQHLQRHTAAARQGQQLPPPAAAAAARRLQAMATSTPFNGAVPGASDAQKRRVREEVKAALRQLSVEQMAEESECGCGGERERFCCGIPDRTPSVSFGWAVSDGGPAACHRHLLLRRHLPPHTPTCTAIAAFEQATKSPRACWLALHFPRRRMQLFTCTAPS